MLTLKIIYNYKVIAQTDYVFARVCVCVCPNTNITYQILTRSSLSLSLSHPVGKTDPLKTLATEYTAL